MKDRIAHIIRAKNLTAAEFATQLGIQPSSISHLLSGRNNPSLDFVRKLKETFPEYNLDWIVLGQGPMTVSDPFFVTRNELDSPQSEMQLDFDNSTTALPAEPAIVGEPTIKESAQSAELKYVMLVFSDNTFEILKAK